MPEDTGKKKPIRTPVPNEKGLAKKPAKKPASGPVSEVAAIRVLAERTFVLSPEGISLREMARRPEFKGVSNETLSRWAREDGWLQKRRETFQNFRKQVENAIGQSMVTQAREQLQLYDRLHAQFASFLLPKADGSLAAQPKSAESAMMALLKLDDARARVRRELAEMCGHSVERAQTPQAAPSVTLSEEESRQMAHVLMRHHLDQEEGPDDGQPLGLAPKRTAADDDR